MVDGHEGFVHWLNHRGARRGLFVSFHLTDELDHDRRHGEGTRLTRHYFPRRTHSVEEHLAGHTIHRSSEHRRVSHGEDSSHRIR